MTYKVSKLSMSKLALDAVLKNRDRLFQALYVFMAYHTLWSLESVWSRKQTQLQGDGNGVDVMAVRAIYCRHVLHFVAIAMSNPTLLERGQ